MALEEHDYLTDGKRLYRFEMYLPKGEGVILEDGDSGVTFTITLQEFAEMRLYQVKKRGAAKPA